MERPTLQRVRQALGQFKHTVGLGVDCVNPRSWAMLDDEFVERLIA